MFLQVERILECCISYIPKPIEAPGSSAPLTEEIKHSFLTKAESLAAEGLRVIALAQRNLPRDEVVNITREQTEQGLTFLALVGIFDPPRPESVRAVRACKTAGIVVHMYGPLSSARALSDYVLKAYWRSCHDSESYRRVRGDHWPRRSQERSHDGQSC